MGFMDKFNKILSKDVIQDVEEDGAPYGYGEDPIDYEPGYGTYQGEQDAPEAGVNLSGSALEMKLIKPERYDTNTVQKIADHLISKRTVVLNLESTNKESARRLIDFLSGVVYTIEGDISRVSTNTVVIVPNNVHVSGEQLQEQMKQTSDFTDDLI